MIESGPDRARWGVPLARLAHGAKDCGAVRVRLESLFSGEMMN